MSTPVAFALRAIFAALLGHVLLLYVPLTPLWLGALVVVTALLFLLPLSRLVPLALSLTLTTLALEGVSRLGVSGLTPFYRPHEQLAQEVSYRPSERLEMDVPHGDLLAIDPSLDQSLATPRHEVFVTDSLGYRNDQDFSGERLVLVGDSFLVGTETTLAGLLRQRGIPAYNMSFSSIGPLIYADKLQWARTNLPAEACRVLYFFEGNDFQPIEASAAVSVRMAVPRGFQLAVKNYIQAVRGPSVWSKTFFGLLTRAATALGPDETEAATVPPEVTMVATVSGRRIAFLRGYAEVVRRPSYSDEGFIQHQLSIEPPDLIFFIPDKFRVYAPLLDQGAVTDLPHAQWQHLRSAAEAVGVPAYDLTPHLVQRARELAPAGEFTFWPDDTHWSRRGEEVAADVLVQTLSASPSPRCSLPPAANSSDR
jgi:hypothetical protein